MWRENSDVVCRYGAGVCGASGRPAAIRGGVSEGDLCRDLACFEISAKAAPDTPVAELKRMRQSLLADRFKLELHRQRREIAGFQMTVAKRGASLRAAEDPEGESTTVAPRGKPAIMLESTTVAQFAELLAGTLRVPVVEATGIQGRYDFNIDLTVYVGSGNEDDCTVVRAIEEQLGLKLEKQEIQMEMLVIDRAEKLPTEN
jgi:uncharacterized protein (TIGR03435 family)